MFSLFRKFYWLAVVNTSSLWCSGKPVRITHIHAKPSAMDFPIPWTKLHDWTLFLAMRKGHLLSLIYYCSHSFPRIFKKQNRIYIRCLCYYWILISTQTWKAEFFHNVIKCLSFFYPLPLSLFFSECGAGDPIRTLGHCPSALTQS